MDLSIIGKIMLFYFMGSNPNDFNPIKSYISLKIFLNRIKRKKSNFVKINS